MSTKREQALEILKRVTTAPEGWRSDKQPDKFLEWTGYKHEDLMKSWRENKKGPKLLTACGGFASKFGGLIGITGIRSYFELKESLAEAGKPHAWVAASTGADPQIGDILRHTVFHVDVAAGWDGRKLKRVAAGQSLHKRPTDNVENEFDALKWVTGAGPYNSANLQGWLDLDKYFGAAPSVGPTPTYGWLNGWWKVWDGSMYYYYLGPNGDAQYTLNKPAKLSGPPTRANNVGTWTYAPSSNTLVITWRQVATAPAACEETFYNALPGCKTMNATSNLYGGLVATRLESGGFV
jgi:hypothetical protein